MELIASSVVQPSANVADVDLDARRVLDLPRRRTPLLRSTTGRRDQVIISRRRGKYSRPRMPQGSPGDVALDASLRAAAARLVGRPERRLVVQPEDLREKIRRSRSPFVIAFVLDNSWSMHVELTLERTKGVVLELLKNARIYRDKVALIAFRHSRRPDATVCLLPTSSYALAMERLRQVPLSGSTPLPDGIRKAYHILRRERIKYHNAIPVMVIVTDGLPNVPIRQGDDPYEEVRTLCRHLRWEGIVTVVVDTEPSGPAAARCNCREMAHLSGGIYLPLSLLSRERLEEAVMAHVGARTSSGPAGNRPEQ